MELLITAQRANLYLVRGNSGSLLLSWMILICTTKERINTSLHILTLVPIKLHAQK